MPKQPSHANHTTDHTRPLTLWLRWIVVGCVLIIIIIGTVLWIIEGNQAIAPVAILSALGILFGFIQLLPLLFPDGQKQEPPVPGKPPDPPTPIIEGTNASLSTIQTPSPTGGAEPGRPQAPFPSMDRGNTQIITSLYGRDQEIQQLKQWIFHDDCRVIALLGAGGIGKTSVAIKLMDDIHTEFTYVIWRSLQNAPPLTRILLDCMQLFTHLETPFDIIKDPLEAVIDAVSHHRCLLVLDNLESVLATDAQAGHFRQGYEDYGTFIEAMATASHKSCLVLTSREKPSYLARAEGRQAQVRSLTLSGLTIAGSQELLKDIDIHGSDEIWRRLIRLYSGNPLYLKVASEPISTLFDGSIEKFLDHGKSVFGDLRRDPLDMQFKRLSAIEQEIMYWLTIEREPISLETLYADMLGSISHGVLLEGLTSLQRRSMIEPVKGGLFTLQPVIMEYVLDGIIEQVVEEIRRGDDHFLSRHFLLRAQGKEYIRNSQMTLILLPVIERLKALLGRRGGEQHMLALLSTLHTAHGKTAGYTAGNILNVLLHFPPDNIRGSDFSSLEIRQAYLQGAMLPDVNFRDAEFSHTVFTESFGIVASLAFNPAGTLLAAGIENGEVRLWRYPDNTPYTSFQAHTDWTRTIAFSNNGKLLATGSHDQRTKLWNIDTGECIRTFHGHDTWVRMVVFSPDNRFLATASEDQTIRLWDIQAGICRHILRGHSERVYAVSYSPDGTMLASSSHDGTIKIWQANTGECTRTLAVSDKGVGCVLFRSNTELISGSGDHALRFWDRETGQCTRLLLGHTDWIWTLAIRSDGKLIASGGEDAMVRLWDADSGQCLKVLREHQNIVHALAFHPTDEILVSGSEGQTIRFWDLKSGQWINVLQGYTNPVWSTSFSPDGTLLASGNADHTVRLWDISTEKCIKTFYGHTQMVYCVAYRQDGKLLASASQDHTVRIWNPESGDCIATLIGHTERVYSIAFSPAGTTLISAGHDQMMRLWNVRTGECIKQFQRSTSPICSVAYSPQGHIIASGNYDSTIQLWDGESGQSIGELKGHTSAVWSVAFSEDGSLLASASHDHMVRVWDVASGECLHSFAGHEEWVSGVAIRKAGDLVASVGGDHVVRLWDVARGEPIAVLYGHTGGIWKVTFSPDGQTIASCSQDGTIRLWSVQKAAQIALLQNERPYEHMNITGTRGLTQAQKSALKTLGAIENEKR